MNWRGLCWLKKRESCAALCNVCAEMGAEIEAMLAEEQLKNNDLLRRALRIGALEASGGDKNAAVSRHIDWVMRASREMEQA